MSFLQNLSIVPCVTFCFPFYVSLRAATYIVTLKFRLHVCGCLHLSIRCLSIPVVYNCLLTLQPMSVSPIGLYSCLAYFSFSYLMSKYKLG